MIVHKVADYEVFDFDSIMLERIPDPNNPDKKPEDCRHAVTGYSHGSSSRYVEGKRLEIFMNKKSAALYFSGMMAQLESDTIIKV